MKFTRRAFVLASAIGISPLYSWPSSQALPTNTAQFNSIAATEKNLAFSMTSPKPVRLIGFPVFADATQAQNGIVLYSGPAEKNKPVTIPRIEKNIDRLFWKFILFDSTANTAISPASFATDLGAIPAEKPPMDWPKSIKGATCPVDVADLKLLGVRHCHLNIALNLLLQSSEPKDKSKPENSDAYFRIVDGQKIHFNARYVRSLDKSIRELSDAGINTVAVLLNYLHHLTPLTHPRTDLRQTPTHIGAFNLSNTEGLNAYRACVEFLSDRYGVPQRTNGFLGGFIIGNELQSHWQWHNFGEATLAEIVRQYADELRIAWTSVRNTGSSLPVFASFDHFWNQGFSKNANRHQSGKAFLDELASLTNAEGAFPWHIAWHPYPENLFKPAFWKDKTATFAEDSPRITFKNLEVLAEYMQKPQMQYQGKSRRLILSEQGFHAGKTAETEQLQAAAYALAYRRLLQIPTVEAFILHRQMDALGEGGLLLGIWPATGTSSTKRPIWDVVKHIDTVDWKTHCDFALHIAGMKTWEENTIKHGPFPEKN